MSRPVMPPLHAKFLQNTGLIRFVFCVAEEVGYVFVEGADMDPHASAVKGRGWAGGQGSQTERGSSSGVPLSVYTFAVASRPVLLKKSGFEGLQRRA